MATETNLALNIDTVGSADNPKTVARVAVISVSGYLRDGSAPIISRDCVNLRELTKDVDRLKDELDAVLAQGAEIFGESQRAQPQQRVASGEQAPAARSAKPHLGADLKVADVMSRDVKTVQRNDPLASADALMQQGRFRHVVALDDDGRLAGVISHRDLFYSRLTRSMGQGKYAHDNALADILVKQVMQTDVATVDPDSALSDAAALMMAQKIGCLPVLDGDALVGILTESDFLSILAPDDTRQRDG